VPADREPAFTTDGRAFRKRYGLRDWIGWKEHLVHRRTPEPLSDLAPRRKTLPLAWSVPAGLPDSDTLDLIERLGRQGRKGKAAGNVISGEELEPWLGEAVDRVADAAYVLECLAWGHALPGLCTTLSENLWWELLQHLIDVARDAVAVSLEDDPLVHQLSAGELPLTLGYLFPEVRACHSLIPPAVDTLSEGPVELLDGEGLPHCAHLHLLRPLLACWTRCGLMGQRLKRGALRKDARLQYEWLVRQTLRLTRADGTQMLTDAVAGAFCQDLFDAALRLSDDDGDNAVADVVLPGRNGACDGWILPEPAMHSEWAGTAVLRPDWSRSGPRLSVTYAGGSISTELECGREVVWTGTWDPVVEVAGRTLTPTGDWEEICWSSDEDVDYVELQNTLAEGWCIQRQILLAREDRFLLVADAVLGDTAAEVRYRCIAPLTEDMAFRAADETWEGFIVGRKPRGLVLPLALPEWRVGPQYGALKMKEEGLQLSQTASSKNLYAPIFIDLDPRRMRKGATWRQLTVGEQLEVVPDDVAVGYRVQCGRRQWLVYRSLAPRGNRTLLGHNLSTEFLVGRFGRDGEVTKLLEIE